MLWEVRLITRAVKVVSVSGPAFLVGLFDPDALRRTDVLAEIESLFWPPSRSPLRSGALRRDSPIASIMHRVLQIILSLAHTLCLSVSHLNFSFVLFIYAR